MEKLTSDEFKAEWIKIMNSFTATYQLGKWGTVRVCTKNGELFFKRSDISEILGLNNGFFPQSTVESLLKRHHRDSPEITEALETLIFDIHADIISKILCVD